MLINHENSQKIAERIGGILHRNVNIMDEEGRIVASTDPTRIGALHEAACKLIEQNIPEMDVYSIDQMTGSREGINLPLQIDGKTIGVIGVTGNPDELRDIGLVITEMAEILFSETLQTLRQQSISRQRRHFLEQLLFSTPTAPSESFERRGRALGVPLHHIRSVGVLSIDAELQDADTAAFYDTLLSILRNHLGDSILLNHLYLGKKLILFLGADIQPYLLGQLNKALRAAAKAIPSCTAFTPRQTKRWRWPFPATTGRCACMTAWCWSFFWPRFLKRAAPPFWTAFGATPKRIWRKCWIFLKSISHATARCRPLPKSCSSTKTPCNIK